MAYCSEYVTITTQDGVEREFYVHFRYDYRPASFHGPAEEEVDIDEILHADDDAPLTDEESERYDNAVTDALWALIHDRRKG